MGRVFAILLGLAIVVWGITALPGAYNKAREDFGMKPLPAPDLSFSYSPPLIPVTLYVENGRIRVSYDIAIATPDGTFSFTVSPKPVRRLVVILGSRSRQYTVQGTIRIAIPNTLKGASSIEWDDDTAIVTVPEPGVIKFPDE